MKLFYKDDNITLYNDSMLNLLDDIAPNSIDSVVTDPPYELGFMGKNWDSSGIAFQRDTWKKCFEVLKPGGYLLAFGGSRTFHRIACAIEDAGFEIRDTIMWLYGSGFPKSMNIGLMVDKKNGVESNVVKEVDYPNIKGGAYNSSVEKNNGERELRPIKTANNKWNGWGTALKASYEPIIVARKPCEGSCIDNVIKWEVGGINIDECRIGTDTIVTNGMGGLSNPNIYGNYSKSDASLNEIHNGRFPANLILTYDETDYDEVCGEMPYTKGSTGDYNFDHSCQDNTTHLYTNIKSGRHFADEGSASRYFYCAKASKRDRDEGLNGFDEKQMYYDDRRGNSFDVFVKRDEDGKPLNTPKKNFHPTVKPTSLMQYLIRLVTPPNGTILEPFLGSGSTGKAAMYENHDRKANYKFIGIELTEEYLPIAHARIMFAKNDNEPLIDDTDEEEKELTLFDFLGEEEE